MLTLISKSEEPPGTRRAPPCPETTSCAEASSRSRSQKPSSTKSHKKMRKLTGCLPGFGCLLRDRIVQVNSADARRSSRSPGLPFSIALAIAMWKRGTLSAPAAEMNHPTRVTAGPRGLGHAHWQLPCPNHGSELALPPPPRRQKASLRRSPSPTRRSKLIKPVKPTASRTNLRRFRSIRVLVKTVRNLDPGMPVITD